MRPLVQTVEIVEGQGVTHLVIRARNKFVTVAAIMYGVPVLLVLFFVAVYNVSVGAISAALFLFCATAGAAWMVYSMGIRPKSHTLTFDKSGLSVRERLYPFVDIDGFGQSENGGGIGDGSVFPIARNRTIGRHIYIQYGGQHIPVTVGMVDRQASQAFEAFQTLYARYARTDEAND